VEHSAKVGTLEPEMQQQLSGFFDLGTMPEIALVATDVAPTQVQPQATAADVRAAGLQSGHMRFLMVATDNGPPSVVHVRDTLLMPDAQPTAEIARTAFVLDAQTPVYEALARMRAASVQIAIVMQNDTVCGIITLADILKRVLPAGIAAQKAAARTQAA
jgi:CBS domain containing-hemolysin-like protein